jgi:hypothetical protein
MFSSEGLQPAKLQGKPVVTTCNLESVSISAGVTGEPRVAMVNCRIFRILKVKVKVTPEQTTKIQRGSRGKL